jgi:hypothetical protein
MEEEGGDGEGEEEEQGGTEQQQDMGRARGGRGLSSGGAVSGASHPVGAHELGQVLRRLAKVCEFERIGTSFVFYSGSLPQFRGRYSSALPTQAPGCAAEVDGWPKQPCGAGNGLSAAVSIQ